MLAHAEVFAEDEEAIVQGVTLVDEVVEEGRRVRVRDERLHLEDDLDDAVEDGEDKVNLGDARERHSLPLKIRRVQNACEIAAAAPTARRKGRNSRKASDQRENAW